MSSRGDRGGLADPAVSAAGALAGLLSLVVVLLLQCSPYIGRRTSVEGCIQNLQLVEHPNAHDTIDKTFQVGGHALHTFSGGIIGGFHDEDDIIRAGASVRVDLAGDNVIMVRRLPLELCRDRRAPRSP